MWLHICFSNKLKENINMDIEGPLRFGNNYHRGSTLDVMSIFTSGRPQPVTKGRAETTILQFIAAYLLQLKAF